MSHVKNFESYLAESWPYDGGFFYDMEKEDQIRNLISKTTRTFTSPTKKKISFDDYDTWEDPPVAYRDTTFSDPTSTLAKETTEDTKDFAHLMDKVAELLGLDEPIVTSGLRSPGRQVKAMLDLWAKNGGKNGGTPYILNLYGEKCKSCGSEARETAQELCSIWEENPDPRSENGVISDRSFLDSQRVVEKNPISSHQTGQALDYGLASNPQRGIIFDKREGGAIKDVLDFIRKNKLADFELIDEAWDESGSKRLAAHWHVTINSVTPEGEEFLNTPNDDLSLIGSEKILSKNRRF